MDGLAYPMDQQYLNFKKKKEKEKKAFSETLWPAPEKIQQTLDNSMLSLQKNTGQPGAHQVKSEREKKRERKIYFSLTFPKPKQSQCPSLVNRIVSEDKCQVGN